MVVRENSTKLGTLGHPGATTGYAAVRNFLSGQGLLAWEDEGYVIGFVGAGGCTCLGKSAKWRAGRQLMAWMEEDGGKDGVGGHGEQDQDQEGEGKEGEEHPLWLHRSGQRPGGDGTGRLGL